MSAAGCSPNTGFALVELAPSAILALLRVLAKLPCPFLGPQGQSPAQLGGRLMEELLHGINMRPPAREVKP